MRVLILGADGYLGWPTAMHFAARGHHVTAVDSYLKRQISERHGCNTLIKMPLLSERCVAFKEETGVGIEHRVIDLMHFTEMRSLLRKAHPDVVIHYAELPSAPYSMMGYREAQITMQNNLNTTLSLAHAVMEAVREGRPMPHIIKLGTMGEYGTPNYPVKEGWLDLDGPYGRHRFLYPAEPGSLYHVTKVQDTHLLWLYCRTHGLRVTDIMQGPVYGIETAETRLNPEKLGTSFHYDDLFGTVINRFIAQAVAGHPLTVYGSGGQTRGFIFLRDVLQAVELLANNPADASEYRIVNQISQTEKIRDIAVMVATAARGHGRPDCLIEYVPNPREELEEHGYRVDYQTLTSLGFKPTKMHRGLFVDMINAIAPHRAQIDAHIIRPRFSWRRSPTAADAAQ